MKKTLTIISAIIISLSLSFCKDDGIDDLNPSNLIVDIEVSEDGSGDIIVTATAENATGYEFYSGDAIDADPLESEIGEFTYKYAVTGVYLIEVRAYGASRRYLKKESQISIQVGNDIGPIDGEDGYITPLSYEGMDLIWQDEFVGQVLDASKWNYEIGGNGWGNNELQYYQEENTSVEDGYLIIEARKENVGSNEYTSSRLTTQDKFDFQYGRVDIRAILPYGQGIWPALWMLGDNFSTVGWPSCGEVDIMEMIGGGEGRDDTVYGTLHWDNNGSHACTCDQDTDHRLSSGIFADRFHVFSIRWDELMIRWYVDDNLYKAVDITPSSLSEFHNNFFFIFNVAVGGDWPGSPDANTVFPQRMIVDYVRVFQDQ